jgi:hypothetical protein
MDRKVEQRANVKFWVKLGKSVTETLNMLRQAYGDEAMSRTQCFEWYRRFKGGRTSLEDDERSGRPSTSITPENVERIRELVHADRQRMINNTADIVGVSYGSVQTILMLELNMRRVTAKFVPRLLTPEQKEHRVAVCQDLCEHAVDNPSFMSRIITGDESWVYGYDRDKAAVVAMEEPIISTTEEGENEPQLNKDHAHCVCRHPQHCSSQIRPPGPDRQQKVVLRSSAAFEGEHSAKAIGSVAREELDSPRRQRTVSPSTPRS